MKDKRVSLAIMALSFFLFACAAQETELPPTPSGPQAGDQQVDAFGVTQVYVPAGSFLRGTDDIDSLENPVWATREKLSEQPQHAVEITRAFWIDQTEVTNAQFQAFADSDGYSDQQL